MTEFEKASTAMKREAVEEFKKTLIRDISMIYGHEYLTASGEFDEFYQDVINIIKNS